MIVSENGKLSKSVDSLRVLAKKYKALLPVLDSLRSMISKNIDKVDYLQAQLDSMLNILAGNYNSVVRDFNLYYSMFPNFFFAKEKHLKREKYFEIEYGKENEDPIVKSKEIPEWAKNVDTI